MAHERIDSLVRVGLMAGCVGAATMAAQGTSAPRDGSEMPKEIARSCSCGHHQLNIDTPGGFRPVAKRARDNRLAAELAVRENPELRSILDIAPAETFAVSGTFQIPVVAFGYSDVPTPTTTQLTLNNTLWGTNLPSGKPTAKEYYQEVSYGMLDLGGPVLFMGALPNTRSYYLDGTFSGQGPDSKLHEMVEEAAGWMDSVNWDFGDFDNDGPDGLPNSGDDDGFVDLLALVHPDMGGECGAAANNAIWSHRGTYEQLTGGFYETDDPSANGGFIKINEYSIQPSLQCDGVTAIDSGVFCHEFGHAFGLPDLYYRNPYSGGNPNNSAGLGSWCLMASGNHLDTPAHMSAWCKVQLGWVVPELLISTTPESIIAYPVEFNQTIFKIATGGSQYFLLENRQQIGLDVDLPGSGLLIYHVDELFGFNGFYNCGFPGSGTVLVEDLNDFIAVEQADGGCDLEDGGGGMNNRGDDGDPFPGSSGASDFTNATFPASLTYALQDFGIRVENIQEVGLNVTADATGFPLPPSYTQAIDFCFLIDTSGSYSNDLPIIQSQIDEMVGEIEAQFPDFHRFSVATFRDFPFSPYGSPTDYAYRMEMDLTQSEGDFYSIIAGLTASGGADIPESQYEALRQAIYGFGYDSNGNGNYTDQGDIPVGQVPAWAPDWKKVIFLLTDAPFHDAGREPDYPYLNPVNRPWTRLDAISDIQADDDVILIALNPTSSFNAFSSGNSPDDVPPQAYPDTAFDAFEIATLSGGALFTSGRNSTEMVRAIRESVTMLKARFGGTGGCCLDGGAQCVDGTKQRDCEELLGGVYIGDRSQCSIVNCAVQRACCFEDQTCIVTTATGCRAAGGRFEFTYTSCASSACPAGACCFDNGSCIENTDFTSCRDFGGDYQGDASRCAISACAPGRGPCCLPDTLCASEGIYTADECVALGGVYGGDDETCATVTCLPRSACCIGEDGTCIDRLTVEQCAEVEGSYVGTGSDCTLVDCRVLYGACCLGDGTCIVVPGLASCSGQSEIYRGDGSSCADANCPPPPPTGPWYVSGLSGDDLVNSGLSPGDPFRTIQRAINAALPGHKVIVMPGVYPERVDFLGKELEIVSTDGPSATRILGTGLRAPIVTIENVASGRFEGLSVLSGVSTGDSGGMHIEGSAVEVIGCVFSGCSAADDGGGVSVEASVGQTVFDDCFFDHNVAGDIGGAVWIAADGDARFDGCTFRVNDARSGGAVYDEAGSVYAACWFDQNEAQDDGGGLVVRTAIASISRSDFTLNRAGQDGAGLLLLVAGNTQVLDTDFVDNACTGGAGGGAFVDSSNAVFEQCRFESNEAPSGGGAASDSGGVVQFVRCDFLQNTALSTGGGGAYLVGGTDRFELCRFLGNTSLGGPPSGGGGVLALNATRTDFRGSLFSGNAALYGGAAAEMTGLTEFVGCTVAANTSTQPGPANTGGVRQVSGRLGLFNTIVWDNDIDRTVDEDAQLLMEPGTTGGADYCRIDSWTGTVIPGGFTSGADPVLVDPAGSDLVPGTEDDDARLGPGSSAVDAGASGITGVLSEDLDGNPRIVDAVNYADTGNAGGTGAVIDIGAYEAPGSLPPAGPVCIGDANGDGSTDAADLSVMIANFGSTVTPGTNGDLNGDGTVNAADLSVLVGDFGCD